MEQNESPQNGKPLITQEMVVAKIGIELTKKQLSVQKLQDEADALEYTEENIPVISAFLAKLNSIDKVTEEMHTIIKKPFWDAGKACDNAKTSNLAITAAIRMQPKQKFDKLCSDVDRKKKEATELEAKKAAILAGIDNNVITFSAKIAACVTNDELLAVERLINLEKSESNAKKYGEFHAQAIEKYDTVLKPILKDQKEKIKQKEELKKQIEEAEKNDDVEKLDTLMEQVDKIDNEIINNSVKVQEAALNSPTIETIPVAEEIFADTKFRRSYNIEIVDEKEALKRAKNLLIIELNKTAANVVLGTLKDTGAFKDVDFVIVNGIKYSEIKNYK